MEDFFTLRTVLWNGGSVKMIDQTILPRRLLYRSFTRWEDVADAIRRMVVRGAPAIGVAAAMGVALAAVHSRATTRGELLKEMEGAAAGLKSTRPTAVNLFWGIERVMNKARRHSGDVDGITEAVVGEVKMMADEDVEGNRRLGKIGAELIEDGGTILTPCNAGALATGGDGAAPGGRRAAGGGGGSGQWKRPGAWPGPPGAR